MNPVYYHVAPRYTPGSPAQVDKLLALRVAHEEMEFYAFAMSGVLGPDRKKVAEERGLAEIVWSTMETRGQMYYEDLITGKTWMRKVHPKTQQLGPRVNRPSVTPRVAQVTCVCGYVIKSGEDAYQHMKDHPDWKIALYGS